MPTPAPTPTQRVLHFILPVLFLTMSAVFVTVPYGMGQWPGTATEQHGSLLACNAQQPDGFRGT